MGNAALHGNGFNHSKEQRGKAKQTEADKGCYRQTHRTADPRCMALYHKAASKILGLYSANAAPRLQP